MAKPKFEMKTFPGALAGEVLFHIDKHDEGKVLDTGWLSCGLSQGTYLLKTAVSMDDGPWFFDTPGVFEDAPSLLAKAKISAALDPETGRVRFGIKLKKAGQANLRILWQASPVYVGQADQPDAQRDNPQPDGWTKPASEPPLVHPEKQAIRADEDTDISDAGEEDGFYIENAPVTLHAGWKYTLRAHIPVSMMAGSKENSLKVRWETTAEDAGRIDAFGCYTAPEKPGAYEVRAFLEGTDEEASVYMIVL